MVFADLTAESSSPRTIHHSVEMRDCGRLRRGEGEYRNSAGGRRGPETPLLESEPRSRRPRRRAPSPRGSVIFYTPLAGVSSPFPRWSLPNGDSSVRQAWTMSSYRRPGRKIRILCLPNLQPPLPE